MTIDTVSHKSAIAKCAELATLIDRHTDSKEGIYQPTGIDSLVFVRCDTCKTIQTVSEPLFAMVVQGGKKLSLN
ncbi:AraC family transcriptional regulator CmrA, partial [bacterium]|nr:AraC family transcriptional regulator CmrA [bacterium]